MPQGKSVYSNAQPIQRLGEAFASMAKDKVSIPQRNCPDVPNFIEKIQNAQEATRKHNIKFG